MICLIQTCFEGSLYLFVFAWVPYLQEVSLPDKQPPLGYIFSCFMVSMSLGSLLYTIIVMFAYQGHHILHTLGPVFRVFVPMVLYFCIMWSMAFLFVWHLAKRSGGKLWRYEMAVVQSFTAGSNNFVSISWVSQGS